MYKPYCMIAVLVISVSCSVEIDQTKEAQVLMDLSREWAAAAKQQDLEKVLSYWAKDAILIPPNEPPIRGKPKIEMMVKMGMKREGFELFWEPQEAYVSKSGDLGYVLVKSYMVVPYPDGSREKVFHSGVEIWKKHPDGSWKNVIDMYNRDPSITSIK